MIDICLKLVIYLDSSAVLCRFIFISEYRWIWKLEELVMIIVNKVNDSCRVWFLIEAWDFIDCWDRDWFIERYLFLRFNTFSCSSMIVSSWMSIVVWLIFSSSSFWCDWLVDRFIARWVSKSCFVYLLARSASWWSRLTDR